jgi:hypothetical protein
MRTCADLELYLDRRLTADEADGFEAHLARCPECAAAAERWRAVERDLADAFSSQPVPSPIEVRRLVHRATARTARPARAWIAASAAVVAVGMAAAIFFSRNEPEPARSTDVPAIAATLHLDSVTRDMDPVELLHSGLTVPSSGRAHLRIGGDEIDAAGGSKLSLVQINDTITRLRLDAGSVACSVAKREPGREFVVEAGVYRVRVTGTRFSVAIPEAGGIGVKVEAGEVEVSSNGAMLERLAAGERFDLQDVEPRAAALPAPGEAVSDTDLPGAATGRGERSATTPGAAAPTLDTLRSWIVGGQYAEAENELRARLARLPSDVEARSLLADCLRKQLLWGEAAAVYRDVAAAGHPVLSPRASAMLRDIQADHPGSVEGNAVPAQ